MESNSGHQSWQQVPWHCESIFWPLQKYYIIYLFIYLFVCVYPCHIFETSSYRLNQKFQILAGLIGHQVPELHQSLSSHRIGIKDEHTDFNVGSGVLNSLFMLVQQAFYPLGHAPNISDWHFEGSISWAWISSYVNVKAIR